jgi:hypothetical protein
MGTNSGDFPERGVAFYVSRVVSLEIFILVAYSSVRDPVL